MTITKNINLFSPCQLLVRKIMRFTELTVVLPLVLSLNLLSVLREAAAHLDMRSVLPGVHDLLSLGESHCIHGNVEAVALRQRHLLLFLIVPLPLREKRKCERREAR